MEAIHTDGGTGFNQIKSGVSVLILTLGEISHGHSAAEKEKRHSQLELIRACQVRADPPSSNQRPCVAPSGSIISPFTPEPPHIAHVFRAGMGGCVALSTFNSYVSRPNLHNVMAVGEVMDAVRIGTNQEKLAVLTSNCLL